MAKDTFGNADESWYDRFLANLDKVIAERKRLGVSTDELVAVRDSFKSAIKGVSLAPIGLI